MKKQCHWAGLALGCVPIALAAQNTDPWKKLVDGRVSVTFPVTPQEVSPQQVGVATSHPAAGPQDRKTGFMARDTHGTYLLIINSNAGAAFNPEDPAARRTYYDAFCRNVAQREGGTVLARSFFSTPAGEGTEFTYTGQRLGADRLVVKYTRQVLVGPVNYTLTFLPSIRTDSTGQAGHEQRRRFFDSLAVTPIADK